MLVILGKSVIHAWVGKKYVPLSYPILLVLVIPSMLMLAQSASGRVLWGMAKHRTWAYIVLGEGVVNLILSIILVRRYGIMGDALGTAIPLAVTMLFILPQHVCHHLQVKLTTYLREAFLLPLLLVTPLIGVLLWERHWFYAHTYAQVGLQLLIASAVYSIGLGWAFWTRRVWRLGHLAEQTQADELTVAMVQGYQEET
jgi:O-antigen/teichoic acid export membrane protein